MRQLKAILPIGLILLLVASFFLLPFFIKIKNISCQSQYGPCSNDLNQKLDGYKNKSLREAKKGITRELKNDNTISQFSFQLKFPATLKIDLIEDKALFALVKANDPNFYLVNKDGTVIKIVAETNLPRVILESTPPNVGEKVSSENLFALKIVYDLWTLYQIKEGAITQNYLTIMHPTGIKVIFPLEGDKDLLIGSLQLILSRLNGATKDSKINVSTIDLRFKNPVLK